MTVKLQVCQKQKVDADLHVIESFTLADIAIFDPCFRLFSFLSAPVMTLSFFEFSFMLLLEEQLKQAQ